MSKIASKVAKEVGEKIDDYEMGNRRRVQIVKWFSLPGMAFLLVYSYVSFLTPDTVFYAYILLTILFVLISNLIFLSQKPDSVKTAANVLAFLGIPVLIPWLFLGGPLGAGFYWAIVYIPWCFLLAGKRWGTIWLAVIYGFTAVFAVLQQLGLATIAYTGLEILQIFFMAGFSISLFYVYIGQATIFEKLAYKAIDALVDKQSK